MPSPSADTLAQLDAKIAAAMASLHGARAAANRSPNSGTVRTEEICADRVDWLLDKRLQLMAEQASTELVKS